MSVCVCVCVYMSGQPCVPTPPCTASGLDNMAGRWLIDAWRMQPWNAGRPAGRPGTVTPSGGQREEQHVTERAAADRRLHTASLDRTRK